MQSGDLEAPQRASEGLEGVVKTVNHSVVAAFDAEMAVLGAVDADLARSSLAKSARVLAAKLDEPRTSATAASACAKELRDHLAELRSLAPEDVVASEVDDLAALAAKKLKVVK